MSMVCEKIIMNMKDTKQTFTFTITITEKKKANAFREGFKAEIKIAHLMIKPLIAVLLHWGGRSYYVTQA